MTAEEMKEAIIAYRKVQGLSQKKLAEKSKLTQSTVSTMENGAFYPSMYSLLRICDGLNITPAQFFAQTNAEGTALSAQEREILRMWKGYTAQNREIAMALLRCLKDTQG